MSLRQMTRRRFGGHSRSPLALRTMGIQNYLIYPGAYQSLRSLSMAGLEGVQDCKRSAQSACNIVGIRYFYFLVWINLILGSIVKIKRGDSSEVRCFWLQK